MVEIAMFNNRHAEIVLDIQSGGLLRITLTAEPIFDLPGIQTGDKDSASLDMQASLG